MTFSDSVLPWTPNAGPDGFDSARLQKRAYVGAEPAVAVQHDVAVWTRQRQRLPQLLHNPVAGGMRRSVEVKNAPTVMLEDEETIEHAKGQSRNGKAIEGRHDLTVVFEKGQPAPRFLAIGARFRRCG